MTTFTAFITYFSLRPDGQWLTTGRLEMVPDLDRAGLDKLVADRAGTGIQITGSSHDETLEGATEIGGRELFWGDDALLAAAPSASTTLN